jgi:hypothetical protein
MRAGRHVTEISTKRDSLIPYYEQSLEGSPKSANPFYVYLDILNHLLIQGSLTRLDVVLSVEREMFVPIGFSHQALPPRYIFGRPVRLNTKPPLQKAPGAESPAHGGSTPLGVYTAFVPACFTLFKPRCAATDFSCYGALV